MKDKAQQTQEPQEPQKSFSELLMEQDTLTKTQVLASLGMTVDKVADFIGMPLKEFKSHLEDADDLVSVAYRKGKAMIEAELANVVRMQAMNGDSTAIGRLSEALRKQSQSEKL